MEVWGGNRNAEETFALPGLDVWLYSRAYQADHGGDIHYLSTCGHSAVLRFAIADVAGHGASVAPVAARFKRLIVKHMNKLDQSLLAKSLNDEFFNEHAAGLFVTTLLTSYYRPTGHLIVCNAGHPRPLLFRHAEQTWSLLDYAIDAGPDELMNLPLGIIEPTEYYQFAVELAPGDYVVLYSDGFSDVRIDGKPLGEDGFCELARTCEFNSASDLGEQLRGRIAELTASTANVDDETLIILRPLNRAPPNYSITERLITMGKMLGIIRVE